MLVTIRGVKEITLLSFIYEILEVNNLCGTESVGRKDFNQAWNKINSK